MGAGSFQRRAHWAVWSLGPFAACGQKSHHAPLPNSPPTSPMIFGAGFCDGGHGQPTESVLNAVNASRVGAAKRS